MIKLFLFILLTKIMDVTPFKVVGWFNGKYDDIKNTINTAERIFKF